MNNEERLKKFVKIMKDRDKSDLELEKGNKETDWTPAPEDSDCKVLKGAEIASTPLLALELIEEQIEFRKFMMNLVNYHKEKQKEAENDNEPIRQQNLRYRRAVKELNLVYKEEKNKESDGLNYKEGYLDGLDRAIGFLETLGRAD